MGGSEAGNSGSVNSGALESSGMTCDLERISRSDSSGRVRIETRRSDPHARIGVGRPAT
jgi:hypothetical protein